LRARPATPDYASLHPGYAAQERLPRIAMPHALRLSEEAAMLVFFDDLKEFFDRGCFRVRLVTVPFLVSPLPKHLPIFLALVVGSLRMFDRLAFFTPMSSNLVYLDALTGDTERKVNLGAEMCWRPPFLDEFGDHLLATLYFEL
jgi:hypothetical protein